LAVAGAGAFAELFAGYMVVLLYWIAPWAAIVLADWFVVRDPMAPVGRWGVGVVIFALVTPLTIVLFSATDAYTGPVARLLGGTDIGSFVGFALAGGLYILARRRQRAAVPASAPVAA
jgi:NCS1 family nucleobase:cation symporter-1